MNGYNDEVARGAPCMCGACSTCLRDQGYDPDVSDGEVICERCGEPMPYEERLEVLGYVLCEKCVAEDARAGLGATLGD